MMLTKTLQLDRLIVKTKTEPTSYQLTATGFLAKPYLPGYPDKGWEIDVSGIMMPIERYGSCWSTNILTAFVLFRRAKRILPDLAIEAIVFGWCNFCNARRRYELDWAQPEEIIELHAECSECGIFDGTKWFGDNAEMDAEWYAFLRKMHS